MHHLHSAKHFSNGGAVVVARSFWMEKLLKFGGFGELMEEMVRSSWVSGWKEGVYATVDRLANPVGSIVRARLHYHSLGMIGLAQIGLC